MKLHIEFLGVPGAGKSTLQRGLIRFLRAEIGKAYALDEAIHISILRAMKNGGRTRSFLRRFIYLSGTRGLRSVFPYPAEQVAAYGRFSVQHAQLMTIVHEVIMQVRMRDADQQMILRHVFREFSGFQLIKENMSSDETIVMDEGFCHRAIALFARRSYLKREDIREYARSIPLPDAVCMIDADLDECDHRLARRDYPYILRGLSAPLRMEKLNLILQCQEMVEEELADRGVPLFHIDNTGTLASAVLRMERALKSAAGIVGTQQGNRHGGYADLTDSEMWRGKEYPYS